MNRWPDGGDVVHLSLPQLASDHALLFALTHPGDYHQVVANGTEEDANGWQRAYLQNLETDNEVILHRTDENHIILFQMVAEEAVVDNLDDWLAMEPTLTLNHTYTSTMPSFESWHEEITMSQFEACDEAGNVYTLQRWVRLYHRLVDSASQTYEYALVSIDDGCVARTYVGVDLNDADIEVF